MYGTFTPIFQIKCLLLSHIFPYAFSLVFFIEARWSRMSTAVAKVIFGESRLRVPGVVLVTHGV